MTSSSLKQICACLIVIVAVTEIQAYFAFPRQGRAMSFYFPRMGRSGPGETSDQACCGEGISSIYTAGRGVFEVCPRDQACCANLVERTKFYKDVVINECSQDSSLEKIRELIGDE